MCTSRSINKNKKSKGKRKQSNKKSNNRKSHSKQCSSSSSGSGESSDEEPEDDEVDFPMNCQRLGGAWLHTDQNYIKKVYPLRSKLNIIKACPGKAPMMILQSIQVGNMSPKQVDQLIFILTGLGPNVRLNRYLHLGKGENRGQDNTSRMPWC